MELPIKKKHDSVTLTGIIVPFDWDQDGNAISIAISTHGEEEYLICNDDKGKNLYKFIQDSVKVRGQIMEVGGIKLIKINQMEKCILSFKDDILSSSEFSKQRKQFPKRQR
jgi:hypothetical protein